MPFRFAALLLIAFSLFSTPAWSGPAAPIEIEITQPDGTTFIAIPRGDEFANWTETKSGHSVVKKNGTWYYAEKDSAGNLRASNRAVGSLSPDELRAWPKHVSPDTDPSDYDRGKVRKVLPPAQTSEPGLDQTLGVQTQNVLTILVDYSDVSFTYSDASFQTSMYGASDSVAEFFEENSYGNFNIVPAAESYDTANDGIVHVTRGINHPNLGQGGWASEAREIVALADASVDFAAFDTSGDGIVSADELSIVIILAGYETSYGGEAFSSEPNVWGHASSFSTLPLDGVDLSPYTMFGETHGLTSTPANDHQATIGIMCHELGHLMFDLPDLYDTDGSSAGIGDWGLMASGSWNFAPADMWSGESPAHLVAWAKSQVGFTVPDLIDTSQSGVTFPNAGANSSAKQIWIDKYRTANGEYILLENRQMTGYDAGLPGDGLMIWHVDQGVRGNANEARKLVDLEEADGLAELDANTNDGDDGDPYPGSSNNTLYDDTSNPDSKANTGATTDISVSNISASMATMTADLQPASGPVGDHVRYDEDGFELAWGPLETLWIGSRVLNDTGLTALEGIDTYIADPGGATLDISYYESMAGGTPTNLIYSETGIAATSGWNRIVFQTAQDFPDAAERGIVVKIVTDGIVPHYALAVDDKRSDPGTCSGRSYIDSDGLSQFDELCADTPFDGDLNLVALFGAGAGPGTNAITSTPETTGPTNADSVDFEVTFDTDVVNFNNADDVVINHSGTAHTGVTITGTGDSYTATVTGISGDGIFTLAVDTTSDVEDTVGTPLESSVTSDAVTIDNTAPTADTITPDNLGPTNADSIDFNIEFSESVVNFNDGADVTITHSGTTAHSGVMVTGSGSSYVASVTGITGDGSFTLQVNTASDVADSATNPLVSSVTSSSVAIDNTPPDIGIGPPSEDPTAGGPVDYTVSYTGADAVTLVEADITLNQTGDADGSVAVSGSGTSSRTVTISGITGNGTLGISIAAGTASDTAGNSAPAAGPSETFVVENPDPAPEFDSTPMPGTTRAFGEVQIGTTSGELFVTVDNIGTADLTLSCTITGANADQFNLVACPTPVAAEGSVQLSVTCSPDSSGEKTASLDVATNDADEPNVSYPLTCTGVESMPDVIHNHGFEDSDAPGA